MQVLNKFIGDHDKLYLPDKQRFTKITTSVIMTLFKNNLTYQVSSATLLASLRLRCPTLLTHFYGTEYYRLRCKGFLHNIIIIVMRKSITAVTLFLMIAMSSFTGFEKEYGTASCYEEGSSVVPMSNGGYLLSAAYNCGGGAHNWKSYLLHLDANGDTVWSQHNLPVHGKVLATAAGDYLFYGGTKAGLTYDTIRISKANAVGQTTWTRDVFMPLCKNTISDMIEVADGYIATGYYATGSCTSPVYDGFVLKLDLNGNVLWNTRIEGSNNEQLFQVKVTADGGLAAFGYTNTNTGPNWNDYMLVKLTANGKEEWRKTYGNELNNYGYGMEILADGGYVLTGYANTMDVYRLDADGNTLWFKNYAMACGSSNFKVSHTTDNGLAFLGTEDLNGTCNAIFMKTDMDGNMLYKKNWNARLREFRELTDGRFVLTGYASYMPNAVVILFDSLRFASPIDTTINQQPDTTLQQDTTVVIDTVVTTNDTSVQTGVNEAQLEERYPSVKLYPNPSMGDVNIEFYNPNKQNYTLQVYMINGMLVTMNENIQTDKIVIPGNTLAAGPYIYVLQGEGNTYMGKFIME
jgi:hypothetical protein